MNRFGVLLKSACNVGGCLGADLHGRMRQRLAVLFWYWP
jgi:hypothetical protein